MRILAIADEESKYLWDYFQKEKLEGIDLILSSGDLNPNYLSFLATFTTAPVLYVRGNHDDKYEKTPPDGCICIEDQIYVHEGVRILGLGGSMRYRGGFDILLTHSPAYQLNDGLDLPHQGFQVFNTLMDKYHPRFFIHGHVHMSYGRNQKRYDQYNQTHVINAYDRCVFDYEDDNLREHLKR